VQGDDANADPVFKESDVVAALKKASENGVDLQNIRSLAGFERRLNDVTCSGCHQLAASVAFHFPGVDWMADPSLQFDGCASIAAFLWRPDQAPRYFDVLARRPASGLLPRIFRPPAIARQHRTRRNRI